MDELTVADEISSSGVSINFTVLLLLFFLLFYLSLSFLHELGRAVRAQFALPTDTCPFGLTIRNIYDTTRVEHVAARCWY